MLMAVVGNKQGVGENTTPFTESPSGWWLLLRLRLYTCMDHSVCVCVCVYMCVYVWPSFFFDYFLTYVICRDTARPMFSKKNLHDYSEVFVRRGQVLLDIMGEYSDAGKVDGCRGREGESV